MGNVGQKMKAKCDDVDDVHVLMFKCDNNSD